MNLWRAWELNHRSMVFRTIALTTFANSPLMDEYYALIRGCASVPILGSESHFLTCAIYNANTFSFVPSPAVKTGHPQYNLLILWRCRDSNPGPNGFFNDVNKSICRSGWNWTNIKGFGDLYSTVKLHSYIARLPIQPAPKVTCRFICLIKHGLDILMSSRRERDSNPRNYSIFHSSALYFKSQLP